MICENCGKYHDGKYGSGRFCSKECAKGFSTKHIKNKTKIVKCKLCGSDIIKNCHSSDNIICDNCKSIYRHKKLLCNFSKKISGNNISYDQCWFCGKLHCKNDICKKLTAANVRNLIKYFNFNSNTLGTENAILEYNRIKNELIDLYFIKRLPSKELEKIYNYPSHINQQIFPMFDLIGRNLSESVILSYLEHRMPEKDIKNQYHSTWHTTWDDKEVYLRSSYELEYAQELDSKQIKYDVESLRIKYFDTQENSYRCAIPDFYLPDTNTIVEIKSTWTYDEQNMKDKFRAYKDLGYNTKLILDKKELIID